jgi:uncharacterized protein YndB with AHSA1/START domain
MPPVNQPPKLRISKILRATRQEIFDAWTNPECFKRWMAPEGVYVTYLAIDVRVGGAYRIDMQPGTEAIVHTGVYQIVDPPAKLVFTWKSKNTEEKETLVTVELFERGPSQTELVLTHEQLPTAAAMHGHAQGWQSIFGKLESILSSN